MTSQQQEQNVVNWFASSPLPPVRIAKIDRLGQQIGFDRLARFFPIALSGVMFEDRRAGTSKINWKESVMALWIIFRLALDRITGRRVRVKT